MSPYLSLADLGLADTATNQAQANNAYDRAMTNLNSGNYAAVTSYINELNWLANQERNAGGDPAVAASFETKAGYLQNFLNQRAGGSPTPSPSSPDPSPDNTSGPGGFSWRSIGLGAAALGAVGFGAWYLTSRGS